MMGLNTGASRFDSWFPPWQLWRSRLKPPRIRSPSLPRRLSDTGIIQHHIMEAAMKSSVFQSNECHPPPSAPPTRLFNFVKCHSRDAPEK